MESVIWKAVDSWNGKSVHLLPFGDDIDFIGQIKRDIPPTFKAMEGWYESDDKWEHTQALVIDN